MYKKNIILIVLSIFLSSLSLAEDNSVAVGLFKIKINQVNLKIGSEDLSAVGGDSNNQTSNPVFFDKLKCGFASCYGIKDGNLYVIGNNYHGQLGLGDTTDRYEWILTGLTNVTDVTAGYYSGYALVNGEVYSVGKNDYGQLGLGDTANRTLWQSTGVTGVTKIEGTSSSAYLIKNNEVYSVGSNDNGQLGLGDTTNKTLFQATGFTGVQNLLSSSIAGYIFAIKNNETYFIGSNIFVQAGLGLGVDPISTWTNINFNNVTDIAASDKYAYFLKNGEVYSVGNNRYGQLALGSSVSKSSFGVEFLQSTGLTGVSDIEVSVNSGYALKNGELYVVGRNNYGQLGDIGGLSLLDSWTAKGITDVKYLSADHRDGFVVKESSMYGTGFNYSGQLATGDSNAVYDWIEIKMN